jgi:hypothetical protein
MPIVEHLPPDDIYAALAQKEQRLIGERTKAGRPQGPRRGAGRAPRASVPSATTGGVSAPWNRDVDPETVAVWVRPSAW